ncbi:hypothetical protein TEK04_07335 [Klenkia sp. LSe6-5]|uniref:Uncharacterized protein n=1 Tax=Klenkia sesuvii TaxID=3103137 RepID=A0ABU8DUL2_9ACTN
MRRATVGKLLGLAGLAGVAATGVVLARDERERRSYTADDVRARLHARAEAAATAERFAAEHDEPTPQLVMVPSTGREGLWFVPRATTRRGRWVQRAQWQRRRFVDPVTTAVGNQVSRVRQRFGSSGG